MNRKPTTGASVIVYEQGRVLLIKRGKEPYMGRWSLPGGSHEYGETLEECARRELKEETGLEAQQMFFCAARDRITRDDAGNISYHYVLVTYRASEVSGNAVAGDDAQALAWYTLEEMSALETTPGTPEFITEILKGQLT